MELQSDLWLDQPDAHDRIDGCVARDRISADDAVLLHTFVDSGYLSFSLDLDASFCDGFDDDVSQVWTERPADLAVSPRDLHGPTSFRDYDGPRDPMFVFTDPASHLPASWVALEDVTLDNGTRKSFVTHYCTASHYRSRTAMRLREGDGWRRVTSRTERDHRRGLDNPHRH